MIEPQLSAEMERRFDEEFGFLASPIDGVVAGNYPLIKHFLATALEEQKQEYLLRVNMLTRYARSIYRADHSDGEPLQDMLLEKDVLSILNGKE